MSNSFGSFIFPIFIFFCKSLFAFLAFLFFTLFIGSFFGGYTTLNEFEEIKNNNLGIAIVLSSIVITLSLLSHSGVELLLESIVPYSKVPTFN